MATTLASFNQMTSNFPPQTLLSSCAQFLVSKSYVKEGPSRQGQFVYMMDAAAFCQSKRDSCGVCRPDGCGEDSFFVCRNGKNGSCTYIGVADGVGGWNAMGVDPSFMSRQMMANSHALAKETSKDDTYMSPKDILSKAYWKIQNGQEVEAGSTTTCVISLTDNADGTAPVLTSANLGDSGFMVIRGEEVVLFSEFQREDNVPRQLAMVPERFQHIRAIQSDPSEAEVLQVELMEGDIIICATDGLWDNIPCGTSWQVGLPSMIHSMVSQGMSMQDVAKTLVETAVKANIKPDDVTVVAARVVRPVYDDVVVDDDNSGMLIN